MNNQNNGNQFNQNFNNNYTYQLKESLITETERKYLSSIKPLLPEGYYMQPQVNLASIIEKTDGSKFQNELYRNIDACIFNSMYKPTALIEINDSSHNDRRRIERDKKVKCICEEAGIPLIRFWTSYGINTDYMQRKINEAIEQSKNPLRISHSKNKPPQQDNIPPKQDNIPPRQNYSQPRQNYIPPRQNYIPPRQIRLYPYNRKRRNGCYIATCVYGNYDCPEVWVLRRYRDLKLATTWYGKIFIRTYYAISPTLVRWFGDKTWFKKLWKTKLNKKILKLQKQGFENTIYKDKI